MTYSVVLTKEQEQRRNEAKQALDSLEYNTMCYDCKKFMGECAGTIAKVWGGCICKEKEGISVYVLSSYVPELIKKRRLFIFRRIS